MGAAGLSTRTSVIQPSNRVTPTGVAVPTPISADASETTARAEAAAAAVAEREAESGRPPKEAPVDVESVFAKLGGSKKGE